MKLVMVSVCDKVSGVWTEPVCGYSEADMIRTFCQFVKDGKIKFSEDKILYKVATFYTDSGLVESCKATQLYPPISITEEEQE